MNDVYPIATIATFCLVFLRALQQQNVIGGHYIAASVTSFAMAAAEVAMVLQVVEHTWSAVPWIGAGGALGVTIAMFTHRRLFRSAIEGQTP